MKRAIAALLRLFGLVPARRFEALAKETAAIKADRLEWKRKAVEASAGLRSVEKKVSQQAQRIAELAKAAETGPRRQALDALQTRLERAERDLTTAREHLMIVESKLDILEGAANVLDARTRAGAMPSAGETGASA